MGEASVSVALKRASDAIAELGRAEKETLYRALKEALYPAKKSLEGMTKDIRERRFKEGMTCPRCGSPETILNGSSNGKKRYACHGCKRSFGDFTNSPLSGTRYPEKWARHIELMIAGISLKKVSEELKIHISTAFFWRHKVLNGLRHLPTEQLNGIVEADEMYFLESYKGTKGITHRDPRKRGGVSKQRGINNEHVCVMVGRDREKNTMVQLAGRGQMSNKRAEAMLPMGLGEVTALCTDSAAAYRNFAQNHEITHYALNSSKKVRVRKGIYHIQNVNSFHSRLRLWMIRFCGVSTKHMNNYLTWFHFLDDHGTQALQPKVLDFLLSSVQEAVRQTFRTIKMTPLNLPD